LSVATAAASPALPADSYFPMRRRIAAGLLLALSNFMVMLDLTIANVSVPHIAGNLGITLEQGTWIITSYAVAEAVCVPLTGWLAQRFGTVRMFMMAMFGFGVFSLLCGMSVTLGMLVAARIGQGLCGGPIMPMSQALMMRVFPPHQRSGAMGLWAMTVIMAPAFGPIIGGYITDELNWHWIFLINVPIAAGCIAVAWLLLRPLETETRQVPIDRVGLFLLALWIGCLQIMLDIGRDHGWFDDWKIVALALGAGIGFLVFLIWELTEEHPVVELHVFRHRGFSAALLTMSLGFSAFFSGVVAVPQWLQMSLGYTASDAGLVIAIQAMMALCSAPVVARLMGMVDARILVSGGLVWMGFAALLRTLWTSNTDFWTIVLTMCAQGVAVPFMMIPLTAASLSAVRPEETASAAGLQNFVRSVALAFGTSLVLTIWNNSQRVSRSELVGQMHPEQAQSALAASGLNADQSREIIARMVDFEATAVALNHAFMISAVVLFIAAAVIWLSPRVSVNADNAMAH
jgi:DHA2 family multidrug resistance protein